MIDDDGKRKTFGDIFGNDFPTLSRSRTLHDLGAYMTLMECGARGLVVVLWIGARYRRGLVVLYRFDLHIISASCWCLGSDSGLGGCSMQIGERGRVCVAGILDAPDNLGRLLCEMGSLRFKVLGGGR
jgi:hypothetical protein